MGPILTFAEETHASKYRGEGETFKEAMARIANTLADNYEHFLEFKEILLDQRFLPGGRIQAAIGSPRRVTAYNCFVSPIIEDSMPGIMSVAAKAAETMRRGGGIGYGFSTIRPSGSHIVSLDSTASGPLSFMEIFNATCKTVSSAGNRRGAQMAVLRIDHPDIEQFIEAKTNEDNLTQFNISVAITDEFMRAVKANDKFTLQFDDRPYKVVNARYLYEKLMRATWDWAEPGVLFIDRINEMNNLNYCETIAATNPCGEQPLPPNGACLLGSFNLTRYVTTGKFDYDEFVADIHSSVRAMDNVIDNTSYPLPEQEEEAKAKRRMGLGVTGMANAFEYLGKEYGSKAFVAMEHRILKILMNEAYRASALLSKEKGSFPLYDEELYTDGKFFKGLDEEVQKLIHKHGIRNSHLLSIAPTGTISITANNISSGIEPVFSYEYERTVRTEAGEKVEKVTDYGYREWDIKGKTADQCTTDEHLAVLAVAQKYVDSAVSKTINVGDDVTWEEFKDIYMKAWEKGCKGVTTFRAAGERYGILNKTGACYIDPDTGKKTCD